MAGNAEEEEESISLNRSRTLLALALYRQTCGRGNLKTIQLLVTGMTRPVGDLQTPALVADAF